jgi:three-Cys-motif partner protein
MSATDFHNNPYDEGTRTKLSIFELYAQEWIPVFVSPPRPTFTEVHIFDFFSGPGTDSTGVYGSPLRILDQLRRYGKLGLAGWSKIRIVAHLFDRDARKISLLSTLVSSKRWKVPGLEMDIKRMEFKDALRAYDRPLSNPKAAKLLIIDQCGVDEVSDEIFKHLIRLPTTDFIFFLSSSTLHRFRDHPAIKQKIRRLEDSYDVHRAAFDYYRNLIPANDQVFLGRFSIKKRSNIYGLIFGSHHPLGIHKFLQVAWKNDKIAGEADFDIEHEHVAQGEMVLPFEEMRPTKTREFEAELKSGICGGSLRSEGDVIRFCIEAGMTCRHATPVLKQLKAERVIDCGFRAPNVRNFKEPRPIRLL